MFWFAFAAMALQGMGQQDAAKADAITAKSNAKIQNITREANNELAAARGHLTRYQTTRKNREFLRQAGVEYEASTTNLLRYQESLAEGAVDRRIRNAEEGGALALASSAAGVGGSTIDMLDSTNRLRQARIEQLTQRQADQRQGDMNAQRATIYESMLLGLDSVEIADGLNVASVLPRHVNVPSTGAVLLNAGIRAYSETGGQGMFGSAKYTPTTDFVGPRDAAGNF